MQKRRKIIEKMNNIGELSGLITEISEMLKDIGETNDIVRYYWKAGCLAEKLILSVLELDKCSLPVDIEQLAEKLNIRIEAEELNAFENENVLRMNRKIGQLVIRKDVYSGEKIVTINVDKMAPLSSKRYAIANEIAHYLLHKDEENYYENYFIMPMCPKHKEEIAIDIFAIFLLVPVRAFFEEFAKYVKERVETQKIPITTEDWMRYLSERAVLSEYYVAYGYQYLRAVGYWVYQARYSNNEDEKNIKISEEEKTDIIEWTDSCFQKNEVMYLFQE